MKQEEKARKRVLFFRFSILYFSRFTHHVSHITFHTSRFTCYTLLIFWLSAATITAKSPLHIIQANTDSLLVKFEAPTLQSNSQEINERTFTQISFTGARLTTEVGRPSLPVYSQLIGVPIDASPYATVIDSRLEVRQTERIIPAQPASLTNSQPTLIIDMNFYRWDRPHPAKLVEITSIGLIRGQQVARLQIHPIQYNPAKSHLKIYHELLIRIDFNATPSASQSHQNSKRFAAPSFVIESSQAFEKLFQAKLLNYSQAKAWRRLPQRAPAAPAAQHTNNPSKRYKILISRTGMYQITYSELRRAGINPVHIEPETLKMENRGRRVGLHIFDHNTDNRFDRDDSIVFYGDAPIGDRFTNTNVYWLSWGGVGRSQIAVRDAAPKTLNAPTPLAFKKTVRFEQDRKYDRLLDVKSEGADHYFWESLTGGADDRFNQKDFSVHLPHIAPKEQVNRSAEIRIKFQGASRERNARHQARILFNGAQLGGIAEWRQQGAPLVPRKIETSRFSKPADTNVLKIIAEDRNNTPAGAPDFYLDWFEIDYWHTFEASKGTLEFNSETEPRIIGRVQYRVTNLHRRDINVYQIHDGSIVAKLANGRIERKDGNFQLILEDNVTSPTSYFVVEPERYAQVDHITPAKPSIISNPANQADYIIIAHSDFINGIQPLAAFRRSQGLSVIVVDIEEVYDQFNHGIFNPLAIQKFLRHTYTHWRAPKPTYVLLVGDAHYDYKSAIVQLYRSALNRDYHLPPIYVPTFHGWAPASGETAMDHRFVTVSGDDPLPDMFIGRLPVQSPHELDDMVKKIIDYEAKQQPGPWQGRLMQVADNDVDNVGDDIFERNSEQLIEEYIPVGYDTRKIYLRQIESPERTNQAILATIDEGALVIEYSGHGGTQTWADEGIFRIADAENLRNAHLPFIITTTCLNGQFDQPLQFEQRSLSEQFLMGSAGAIGVLSATRLTFATANAAFDKNLFTSIFTVKPSTLGAIIADAKTQFMMTGPQLWIPTAMQYTLFGDPATRLAVPELEIQVELENVAVDPSKELIIRHNAVGQHQFSPITGTTEFHKATDFSTRTMFALALFANDLDDNSLNDLPQQKEGIQVWQGDFGAIRIPIPEEVAPGQGIVRLLAFDDQRTAIGGGKFWTYQPAILEVREDLDPHITNTLNLSALIADNEGPTGLKLIKVAWSDSVDFKERTVTMIPHPAPPTPAVNGGRWHKLHTAIPLPKGGETVQYQIVVTDSTNHTIRTDKKSLKVPEGANIAIASAAIAPLRYTFSKDKQAHTLIAKLVNDGGQKIDAAIEVWFAEGDPDRNGDSQIDPEADILGRVLVRTDTWYSGETHLQETIATLILPEPLPTGFHQIYVFADPESPDDDHEDGVIGKLDEPRSLDNKGSGSFVVNEFTLKTDQELTAFSLDRIFDAVFPTGAILDPKTTLSVNTIEPPISFQPDLRFVPLPRRSAAQIGAYQIELYSDADRLIKPVSLKFRPDLRTLKDHLGANRELNPGAVEFYPALQKDLAIYQWKASINAWKRLPSEVTRDHTGNLVSENFATPTQAENTGVQKLRTSDIRVDPRLTPLGRWAILLLDAERYRVLLQRQGNSQIEEIEQTGYIGQTLRDGRLGIELEIPRLKETDVLSRNLAFEFGDVLTFETDLNPSGGGVSVSGLWNTNRGAGSAHVNIRTKNQIAGKEEQPDVSDWLIFFRDSEHFELRNARNNLALHTTGNPAVGKVNQLLILDNLGIEVLVSSPTDLGFKPADNPPFGFGDKFKFSKTTVGIVAAKTTAPSTYALMQSADQEPPKVQLWIDGEVPNPGSTISPRPQISLLLTDKNGVDLDSFNLAVSKDGGVFETIKHLEIGSGEVTSVSIRYKPTLFIGSYRFRIGANDLTGNTFGGEDGFRDFNFSVAEQPDLEPPKVEIHVNDEILTEGTVIREQPKFEILIADENGISPTTVQFAFGPTSNPLSPLPEDRYELQFDVNHPTQAWIAFEPNLPNDQYQLQVLATDTSENTFESQIYRFHLKEPTSIAQLLNVPNPIRTITVFTYNLAQAPDQVTVKIYTVSGRLIRTIEDASARRGYNETDWDARDENGERLANGVYFYKLIVETDGRKIEKIGRLAILR